MHGRLKIKTTAEQEAEKNKEREQKRSKYLRGLNIVLSKRKAEEHDEGALTVTAQLLASNPDVHSLWNFRREIFLSQKKLCNDDCSKWQDSLINELTVTETCLLKNPKSYGAWHHRSWVLNELPSPPWQEEVELCNKYLQLDDRNFHCWDHRRIAVTGSNRSLTEELQFTQDLINLNFSNYSAWHYRSKLLPVVYPAPPDSPHPIAEDMFVKELKSVEAAVFTDPSDQSPWFFLRWLICIKSHIPKLIQVGVKPLAKSTYQLILVYSSSVSATNFGNVSVHLDNEVVEGHWLSLESENRIWGLPFSLKETCSKLKITTKGISEEFDLPADILQTRWISQNSLNSSNLSKVAKSSLTRIMEDCILLDDIDPGNKWVLLTLVDVMRALDLKTHLSPILQYLRQLEEVDPLRAKYFVDICSSVNLEVVLQCFIHDNAQHFTLQSSKLSRIDFPHYLCCATKVDLSDNNLRSCGWAQCLISCRELILDGNPITDFAPLAKVTLLEKLSLRRCNICVVEQLAPLKTIVSLIQLRLEKNPISSEEQIVNQLKLLVPNVQQVIP